MEPETHDFIQIVCTHCGEIFDVPKSCGNRFCEICCEGRRSRARRRLRDLISAYRLKNGHSFKHLTLTIRNQSDARQMCDNILSAFRRLRQRTFWKRYVDGGVFVIEITGRPGNWHVHLHIVIAAAYIPWNALQKEWKRCSGGLGVYIKRIPVKEIVVYLTKYLSKTQLPAALQWEASAALKGRRLFQPFGSFHNQINLLPKLKPTCSKCGRSAFEPLEISLAEIRKQPEEKPQRNPICQVSRPSIASTNGKYNYQLPPYSKRITADST